MSLTEILGQLCHLTISLLNHKTMRFYTAKIDYVAPFSTEYLAHSKMPEKHELTE